MKTQQLKNVYMQKQMINCPITIKIFILFVYLRIHTIVVKIFILVFSFITSGKRRQNMTEKNDKEQHYLALYGIYIDMCI